MRGSRGALVPKVDLESIEQTNRTGYPPPFNEAVAGRFQRRLAPATGLTELGASHVVLRPGAWSSQRHWHEGEDELLVMIFGEATLIEDDGESLLRAGDVAVFPKGRRNGHHLVNKSSADCAFICISAGAGAGGAYSDIDMAFTPDGKYVHKDGAPYEANRV
jgi:uncharacterized cupin superfamily protein